MAEVRAPVGGKVAQIHVTAGARVAEDDELLLMESMKMEIPIHAPSAGTVGEVRVSLGATVQPGEVLLTLA